MKMFAGLLVLLPVLSFAQVATAQETVAVDDKVITEIMSFATQAIDDTQAAKTPEIQYNLARTILGDKEKNRDLAYQLLKMSADAGYVEAAQLLRTLN